jgi:glutamate synthase (NADPH/NADH) large chain
MQTGLVVETGEAREVHHFCALAGYGAEAINPVAFETLEDIRVRKELPLSQGDEEELHQGGRQGHPEGDVQDGHLTYQSYCGAQIFDAIGLSSASSRSTSPAPPPPSRASA